jgi:hypothetical protein
MCWITSLDDNDLTWLAVAGLSRQDGCQTTCSLSRDSSLPIGEFAFPAGSDDALHRLEELFYAKALSDPVLKDVFTKRVATHVDHLAWFTAAP